MISFYHPLKTLISNRLHMAIRKYPYVGRSDTKLAVPINKRHNCNTGNWLHSMKVSASNDITILCRVINSVWNFNELGNSNNNIFNLLSSQRLVPWSSTTLTQTDRKTWRYLYRKLTNCRQHTQITLQSERHIPLSLLTATTKARPPNVIFATDSFCLTGGSAQCCGVVAWWPTEASSDSRPPGKTSGNPAANESWVCKRKTHRHNFQLFSPPSHTGCPCYRFPERAAALSHRKPASASTCRYSYHVYGHDKRDILYNSFACLFPLATTNK